MSRHTAAGPLTWLESKAVLPPVLALRSPRRGHVVPIDVPNDSFDQSGRIDLSARGTPGRAAEQRVASV
jgi:hypothetical protein